MSESIPLKLCPELLLHNVDQPKRFLTLYGTLDINLMSPPQLQKIYSKYFQDAKSIRYVKETSMRPSMLGF